MALEMEKVEGLLRGQFGPFVSRDQDGDLEVTIFSAGDNDQVTMWVLQSGRNGDVLECIAESTRHRVQRSRWAEAVWVCNQWNQSHLFPRVSLFIPAFATSEDAPVQCRTLMELQYGQWDTEFLDAQFSHAASYSVGFYEWIDKNPDLARLFGEYEDAREHAHIHRLAENGQMAGATSFAEEFLADDGFPRIREPESFFW